MVKKEARKERKKDDVIKVKIDDLYLSYSSSFEEASLEKVDEKEAEKIRVEIEEKTLESLRVINEETLQLSEFLIEDKNLARELCRLIKPVLKHLNRSFTIPSRTIPNSKKSDQIILNEDGHLIFADEKGKVNSKPLDEYPSEIILIVFLNIIPKLGRLLRFYRKKVGMRVNLFEKIYRELDNANRAFSNSEAKPGESLEGPKPAEENGIKKILFSKQ